jgi:hypothetical protein
MRTVWWDSMQRRRTASSLVLTRARFPPFFLHIHTQVIHCRWAMLGAAGMIAPEALAAWGVTPDVTGLPWFKTGVIPPAGTVTRPTLLSLSLSISFLFP